MESNHTAKQPNTQHWFPYTKLQPPQLSKYLVTRSQLSAQLFEAISRHKLTLVAAPAGSGKTSLLSTLPQSGIAIVWVALDAADDEFPVFVALLVAALQAQLQDDGEAILGFLQTVPNADDVASQLATLLINHLKPFGKSPTEQDLFAIILDDYHALDSTAIHQFIAYLLDYMPPFLRLIIGTRHDPPLPLPKLRMRRQLAEIRLSELRFDVTETAVFLNQRYHLQLTEGEIAHLHQHTQGWVAGLQLLATVLTTTEQTERSTYINQLGPTNRSIFDLLATEVYALQPPDIQHFLLQTSVLPELTPANCQAITQNPAAAHLLESIYQRNLFLRTLTADSRSGPFRYHDLFSDFLQQQLRENDPQQWRELHQRAAHVAINDEQKLNHLMQAQNWDEAAVLLETMGQEETEYRLSKRFVVQNIESLPPNHRQQHPWLLLIVGQYHAARGQVESSHRWLEQAAVGFREQGDEFGELEILTARAMSEADDSGEVVKAYRQKAATVGHLFRPENWIVYHGSECWHAIVSYDWETINHHLLAGLNQAMQSRDPGVLTMACLTVGPQMLFNDQGMAPIETFASHARQFGGQKDWILQIGVHSLLAFIRFFQGQVAEADHLIREAHRLSREIGGLIWIDDHISWLILALATVSRAYRAFDDFFATESIRRQTQDPALADDYLNGFLYLQGRSFWLQGRPKEAQAVFSQMQTAHNVTLWD